MGDDMKDKVSGIGGDDYVKYGTTGRFSEVLEYLNTKFTPNTVHATKADWDQYVQTLGGDPQKHTFGRFAAYLLKDLFADGDSDGKEYPTKSEWLKDCSTYQGQPIDPVAFKAMANALRDNLEQNQPAPMYFAVTKSYSGVHEVTQETGDLGGVRGIVVTMKCPP